MQILHKVTVIARFLNLTERRVQQLVREGIIPRPEKGKYDLVKCVQSYVRYLQERAYGSGDLPQEIHIERARLIKAQADKTELEVATLQGQLVPLEAVERDWMQHVTACRLKMLAIPTKSAFQIAGLNEPPQIEKFLKHAIGEALSELASDDDELPAAKTAGKKSVDATTGTKRKSVGGRKPALKSGSKRRTRKVEDK